MSFSIQNNVSNTALPSSQTSTATTDTSAFQAALDAFYEIHQQSQITGVPTTIYNQALAKIGIDTSDTFAASEGISLLQSYGYNTDKPTDEAIVKYGNLDVSYGNKSYMKNGASLASDALKEEITTLNEETDNKYAGAQNYYDIALENIQNPTKQTSVATKVTVSSIVNAQTEQNDVQPTAVDTDQTKTLSSLSTDDTLQTKLKTQILSLVNNNEEFLREILKDL